MTRQPELASWPERSVGELFTVLGGGTPSTRNVAFWNGTIPWVTSADLKADGSVVPRRYVTPEAVAQSATNIVPAGSVIVATRVGLGKVAITTQPTAFSQDCNGLILDHELIEPRFALYQLQHWVQSFKYTSRGTTIAGVTRRQLLDLPFRVPPREVQGTVAAYIEQQLSRVAAAIQALERASRNVAAYRVSSYSAALSGKTLLSTDGDAESGADLLLQVLSARRRRWIAEKGSIDGYREPPAPEDIQQNSLPRDWSTATLEQLTDPIRTIGYGILMPKEDVADGVPYVRVKDMADDRINLSALRRTSPQIASAYRRSTLKSEDLLIAIRGSYGRVAVVPPELDGGNITQDSARLDISPLVHRDYVAAYLRGPAAQTHLERVARGVAVKGVNIGDLRLLPVPLPPVSVQRAIVEAVERDTSVAGWLEGDIWGAVRHAGALRRAVLRRALAPSTGEEQAA